MNNINEMLDILELSETNGRIYLEDIMKNFHVQKEQLTEELKNLYRCCLLKKMIIINHIK